MGSGKGPIRAVLFDFDGTLTRPGSIDFARIRTELDCPIDQPILEFVLTLPKGERERALRVLDQHEMAAAADSETNPGCQALIDFLNAAKIPFAIASRNSRLAVLRALENIDTLSPSDFAFILTRDDPIPVKPNPDTVLFVAERLEIEPKELLCVGDYVFDIEAGHKAGAPTVLLESQIHPYRRGPLPDHRVKSLDQIIPVIRMYEPLECGKLPNNLLGCLLDELQVCDPDLVLGPGVGRDTAVLQIEAGSEVLLLKSDPVTFATESAGFYTVVVNANDILASGGVPRWFLATLLLPPGCRAVEIRQILSDLRDACEQFSLTLCGGHTEVTDAVTRPVVAGHCLGRCERLDLATRDRVKTGDEIILTKAAAIEGTTIIAREFADALREYGFTRAEVERCQRFLQEPGISLAREAAVCRSIPEVTAMHDVTEGGVATALAELSSDTGFCFQIQGEAIPVLPETRRICNWLEIDPWGLIGSGSLLITARPSAVGALLAAIRGAGVAATRIGGVTSKGSGIELLDSRSDWPEFGADELVRALKRLGEIERPSPPPTVN